MEATILGCGVAGSWMAHNLAVLGCSDFVLFGGLPPSQYLLELGPYTPADTTAETAAETLARHIKRLVPDANLEVHGQFDIEANIKSVKGLVVGAMDDILKCEGSAQAVIKQGHAFVTLGLPATKNATITFGTDPSVLQAGQFGGPPIVSKYEIMRAAVQALEPFFASDQSRYR